LDVMTFRGALDKVGAQPQFGQRHEYKSAAETFMSTEISAPNREMTQRIADSAMERVADRVCAARGLEPEAFTRAVADSPLTATQARDAGLVDRIGYRHDIYAELRSQFGTDDGRIHLQFAHRYAKHQASRIREQAARRRRPVVALVRVHGQITVGRSGSTGPFYGPTARSELVCVRL